MSNQQSTSKADVKVAHGSELEFVAASHEDPINPGALKKVLFDSSMLPTGKIQMVNWAKLPSGKSFQSHYHEDMHEVFVITSGRAEMRVADQFLTLQGGDAVIVPAGSIHAMTALDNCDVSYMVFGVSEGRGGKTIIVK